MDGKVEVLEEGNETTGCADGIGKHKCTLSGFQKEDSVEEQILGPD